MITGFVVSDAREAIVRLLIKGAGGTSEEVETVVDTGFTEYLTLPSETVAALALPFLRMDRVQLSDESIQPCPVHEAVVVWDGVERTVEVQVSPGAPLLGMLLLRNHLLTIPVVDGGTVVIQPLP